MSYFDNFLITLILCVGAGFATDNLNKFMKVPMGGPQPPASVSDVKGDQNLPKPEAAEAKIEETLAEIKGGASTALNNLNDLLS